MQIFLKNHRQFEWKSKTVTMHCYDKKIPGKSPKVSKKDLSFHLKTPEVMKLKKGNNKILAEIDYERIREREKRWNLFLTRILKLINFSQTDQEKFEKTQVKNIKNDRSVTSTDSTNIQKITGEHDIQLFQ